jgi:SAM-dependent methyltransferase
MIKDDWFKYQECGSFFGPFYQVGDSSKEGYMQRKKMSLDQRTKREVDGLIRLMNLEKDLSILDVPCGYGRHIQMFYDLGYSLSGLDINKYYVDGIKKKYGEFVDVRCGEMKKMPYDNDSFDAVINMFFSFGFYCEERDNIECMREMYRVLKNNGKLAVHTDVNISRICSGEYHFKEERSLCGNSKLIINETYDKKNSRLNGVWSILDENGIGKAYEYSMRVYSVEEYKMMGYCVGFQNVNVFGSFDCESEMYDPSSEEVILVFQK